ncbi:MAG: alpha/beta hydrolase [Chryseolinea sp.]
MKDLFLLSGLGADKRVFDFLDFGEYNVHHIVWINPLENETIQEYARRLCNQIHISNPILIGVSFGGMIAMEIGKIIKTEKIILISSARTKKDIPQSFKLTGRLKLHYTIPPSFIANNNPVTNWLFGAKTASEKELLSSILKDTDVQFSNWAIEKIVRWDNVEPLQNVTQIHGTKDKTLPFKEAKFVIDGGEHLMIVNRADEVSRAIKNALTD